MDALNIVAKLLADPIACAQIYGAICGDENGSTRDSNLKAMTEAVQGRKFLLTVHDDASMKTHEVYCLPVSCVPGSMPVLVMNEKYTRKTEFSDCQIFFLVCKLLRAIGHTLTAGAQQTTASTEPTTQVTIGPCMTSAKRFVANYGAQVEESAYGGRLGTTTDTARPYQHPLNLLVKKFDTLPPAPCNYAVYEIDPAHIIAKVAQLQAYLADPAGLFPGLRTPREAMGRLVEGEFMRTEKQARRRLTDQRLKRKRRSERRSEGGCAVGADSPGDDECSQEVDEEEDEEFMHLVELGIAFSRKQQERIAKGFRI
jgi:hypothetical protein